MSDVQLSEIEKSFGEKRVLDRLNLSVLAGEYLVILGPSGCGKTTLLRLIAGLERPDSGRIAIGGQDVSRLPPRRRDVAMVFQGDALYPHLTVAQSLRVGLRRTLTSSQIDERIESATRLVGVGELLDRKPDRLSGGELRRAALAKAIVRHSSVRLLDEPLSALDSHVRHGIQQAILRWHRSTPGTTIHVTHDGQEAMRMADRIAVVDAGQVVHCGTPAEIYTAPINRAVALALGSPPISLFAAVAKGGQLRASNRAIKSSSDIMIDGDDGPVEIGVRAESCQVSATATRSEAGMVMTGKLLRIEPMGGRSLAAVELQGDTLTAEVDGNSVAPGAEVTVFVPALQLHVFDQTSGQRRQVGIIT